MQAAPTTREFSASLRAVIDEFSALLPDADEQVQVPTCPGWTVWDLVVHLGTIHRWAASILLSGKMHSAVTPLIRRPLDEWYRSTADALLAAIDAVAPDEPIPNFAKVDEYASFWVRRQLHETTVHLYDLTTALSAPEIPISSGTAADGVEEIFTVFFRRLVSKGTPPDVRENIRIQMTDLDDGWVLVPGDPVELRPFDTPSAASVSGSALDLYLGLWGRVPIERLHFTGDSARALLEGPTSI